MKVYLLKESDFEKFQMLIEKLEAEQPKVCARLEPGESVPYAEMKRAYRYHLLTWMAEVQGPKS